MLIMGIMCWLLAWTKKLNQEHKVCVTGGTLLVMSWMHCPAGSLVLVA